MDDSGRVVFVVLHSAREWLSVDWGTDPVSVDCVD